jgi:hypothetical protein
VLDQQLFVALAGPQSFASTALHGPNCLTRPLSNGHTRDSHPGIPPVIACPGHAQGLA